MFYSLKSMEKCFSGKRLDLLSGKRFGRAEILSVFDLVLGFPTWLEEYLSVHRFLLSSLTFAFGFFAGINRGSCFWINHFPEDNDYDTDSSEYILRKSVQPLHLQTLQLLIHHLFFCPSVMMELSQECLMCHDISIPPNKSLMS